MVERDGVVSVRSDGAGRRGERSSKKRGGQQERAHTRRKRERDREGTYTERGIKKEEKRARAVPLVRQRGRETGQTDR